MEYDKDKITKLMLEAENSLQNLNELSNLPEEEFLKNKHYIASAKYNLLITIEACIDIAYHIISKNRMRLPRDYADSFKVLVENNVISEDLSKRLMLMARFRNRLVHIYWDVDDRMVYHYIKENISDVEEFLKRIRELLFG
ncbi:type VII toxin-antitoxin system HepT family RNase toxin [Thermococcus sp. PK]|uniref:type VII toxin-antitoxin system HepT family RNase toxin n=1 Tax=Thermococcus sp. PK TaxID=913025 RepID=UPI0005B298A4|nr:DUF86 domain-containing protein [Thermococcus sp. PK]